MRIVIATGIFPPDIGGPATYAKFLLDHSNMIQIEPVILTYGKAGIRRDPAIDVVPMSLPKGIRHALYFLKLMAKVGFFKNSIIFAVDSSIGTAGVAAVAAAVTRAKFIVRVTGDYAWEQGRQRFGVTDSIDDFQKRRYGFCVQVLRYFGRITVRRANRIIVPSEYLKKLVIGWGVDLKRIIVIPNPVVVYSSLSKIEARKKLGIQGSLVVSAGRFVPWKGFRELIQIFPRIRSECPDAMLALIGDGPDRHSLEAEAEKSGVRDTIRFTGSLSKIQLVEWFSAADLFVLNSSYEGLSHQLIEAVGGFGLLAVATDAGGNAEVQMEFPDRITLVRSGDKAGLMEAVIDVLKKPAVLVRSKQGAGKFSLEAVAGELQKFFSTLTG